MAGRTKKKEGAESAEGATVENTQDWDPSDKSQVDFKGERWVLAVKQNGKTYYLPQSEALICAIPPRKDEMGAPIPTHKYVSMKGTDGAWYRIPNGALTSSRLFPHALKHANPRYLVKLGGPKPTKAKLVMPGISAHA